MSHYPTDYSLLLEAQLLEAKVAHFRRIIAQIGEVIAAIDVQQLGEAAEDVKRLGEENARLEAEKVQLLHSISELETENVRLTDVINLGLRQRIDELETDNRELAEESEKLLAYAREAAGRRDVHSVYEVLDLVPAVRAYERQIQKLEPEVERMKAHIDRLTKERAEMEAEMAAAKQMEQEALKHAARFEQERDQLRQILRSLYSMPLDNHAEGLSHAWGIKCIEDFNAIIREALGETEEEIMRNDIPA